MHTLTFSPKRVYQPDKAVQVTVYQKQFDFDKVFGVEENDKQELIENNKQNVNKIKNKDSDKTEKEIKKKNVNKKRPIVQNKNVCLVPNKMECPAQSECGKKICENKKMVKYNINKSRLANKVSFVNSESNDEFPNNLNDNHKYEQTAINTPTVTLLNNTVIEKNRNKLNKEKFNQLLRKYTEMARTTEISDTSELTSDSFKKINKNIIKKDKSKNKKLENQNLQNNKLKNKKIKNKKLKNKKLRKQELVNQSLRTYSFDEHSNSISSGEKPKENTFRRSVFPNELKRKSLSGECQIENYALNNRPINGDYSLSGDDTISVNSNEKRDEMLVDFHSAEVLECSNIIINDQNANKNGRNPIVEQLRENFRKIKNRKQPKRRSKINTQNDFYSNNNNHSNYNLDSSNLTPINTYKNIERAGKNEMSTCVPATIPPNNYNLPPDLSYLLNQHLNHLHAYFQEYLRDETKRVMEIGKKMSKIIW